MSRRMNPTDIVELFWRRGLTELEMVNTLLTKKNSHFIRMRTTGTTLSTD
jgi:hypothetical protein